MIIFLLEAFDLLHQIFLRLQNERTPISISISLERKGKERKYAYFFDTWQQSSISIEYSEPLSKSTWSVSIANSQQPVLHSEWQLFKTYFEQLLQIDAGLSALIIGIAAPIY